MIAKVVEVLKTNQQTTEKTLEINWAMKRHSEIVHPWAEDGAKEVSQISAQKNKEMERATEKLIDKENKFQHLVNKVSRRNEETGVGEMTKKSHKL